MGHTKETRVRAYFKMMQTRCDWLEANGPCKQCGSWSWLEVDHIIPEDKENHAVWSWKKERRDAELAKCQVLCHDCHKIKSAIYCKKIREGKPLYKTRKITDEQVEEAKRLKAQGLGTCEIAKMFDVSHERISVLTRGLYPGSRHKRKRKSVSEIIGNSGYVPLESELPTKLLE